MFQAQVDKAKNLLQVGYTGRVGPDETKRVADEVQRLLGELEPGFRLLTDLSGLEAMEMGCVPHIRKMMDVCNQKGVELVVRVVPDPHKDIGLNILSLFHYRRRVRIVTSENLEEAMKVLAG